MKRRLFAGGSIPRLSRRGGSFSGVLLAGVLSVLFLAGCAGLGGTQTLRGTVRIYGNEPHTYAAIESGGKIYGVPPGQERELRKLQGQEAEFKVRLLEPEAPPPFCDGMVNLLSWKLLQ
ncbi:MAG: hypothetical protein LBQ14_09070 [Treponema sp.]|nr:hypothetical protein [Treponema sp.]